MRIAIATAAMIGLAACASQSTAEDPADWYDPGQVADVEEFIAFTEENYDFPANNDTIVRLKQTATPSSSFNIAYGPQEDFETSECGTETNNNLPFVVEGLVTIHPRFYFKSDGCDTDSDEKYYGSFFIQDKSGGIFVLGDSKVAHFDVGDHVKLNVRGTRDAFDLPMIYSHDVIEVERGPFPLYAQDRTTPFNNDFDAIGSVWRVAGEISSYPDTFGEFTIDSDAGPTFSATLDSDLSRRGVDIVPGKRIVVTGPLLYSYSVWAIVIMKRGQIEFPDE